MRPLLALLILAIPANAMAAGPPDLLKGQRFTYSEQSCRGEPEPETDDMTAILSTLEVNEAGIFAYEFGCAFLEFWPGDEASDMPYNQTVLASCGDDSGITRPDVISLVFDTGESQSVTVTSQNEYVMGQTFISRTYPICRGE
jgi:hypothetical protein